MKRITRLLAVLTALALSLSFSACSKDETKADSVKLTVFAAKSLTKAFQEIADDVVSNKHPELEIAFSFDGSNTLVKQIAEGAPVDVLATADQKNMQKALDQGLVQDVKPFASNVLTLIVPAGNPAGITGLDASLDGKKLVVCAEGVPCGNATKALAENLNVTLNPVSEEKNVGDVRAKVETGEADAGLVYVTDAKSAGEKVDIVTVPGAEKVVNAYPIAVVKESKQTAAAEKFIEVILSEDGQKILAKYGFSGPELADQA